MWGKWILERTLLCCSVLWIFKLGRAGGAGEGLVCWSFSYNSSVRNRTHRSVSPHWGYLTEERTSLLVDTCEIPDGFPMGPVLCLALFSVWLPYVVSMEAISLWIYIRPIVTAAERKCASFRLCQKGPSDVSPPQAMLWALPGTRVVLSGQVWVPVESGKGYCLALRAVQMEEKWK